MTHRHNIVDHITIEIDVEMRGFIYRSAAVTELLRRNPTARVVRYYNTNVQGRCVECKRYVFEDEPRMSGTFKCHNCQSSETGEAITPLVIESDDYAE